MTGIYPPIGREYPDGMAVTIIVPACDACCCESVDGGVVRDELPIMDAMQRWRDLTVNAPFSRSAIWIFRIWSVLAITILIWIGTAESSPGALVLAPFVLVLLAAIEVMAWSYRRKIVQVAEAGIPVVAVVTGKGITSRGGLSWVSVEYSVGGQNTESAAYVSHRTLLNCRVGDQLPIRVLQRSPRFWMSEGDVDGRPKNVGQ